MANPLPVNEDEANMWQLGNRYSSASMAIVSLERWQLWKDGFTSPASAKVGEGSHECKDLSGRAAALIDVIEKSRSF
jgi:hypothetical protein